MTTIQPWSLHTFDWLQKQDRQSNTDIVVSESRSSPHADLKGWIKQIEDWVGGGAESELCLQEISSEELESLSEHFLNLGVKLRSVPVVKLVSGYLIV